MNSNFLGGGYPNILVSVRNTSTKYYYMRKYKYELFTLFFCVKRFGYAWIGLNEFGWVWIGGRLYLV